MRIRRDGWVAAGLWLAGSAMAAESLEEVTVTATPLGDTSLQSSQPVSVIRGTELDRRRGPSLGDTLDRLPGVHSSGFGTAAGRPVIRGFSGSRVGIAENGLDTMDASAVSPDHAVPIDPLGTTQIEVLRGPATLLYGSGAIGGLVNAVTDRIPTAPQRGVSADALLGGDSVSRERLGSFRLRGGTGGEPAAGPAGAGGAGGSFAWTLGGFSRNAGDYGIPGRAVVGDPASASGRLPNSWTEGHGLAGGASWIDRWGVAGVSIGQTGSRYGIPAEQDVYIDLSSRRIEGLLELDRPLPALETVRLRTADVRYRHEEIQAPSGEVGTRFDSRGRDTRLEAAHMPLAGVRGILGLHTRERTLSASGDEAYLPASTKERETALFWAGDRAIGPGRIEFGLRQGAASRSPAESSGFESRTFDLTSWSVGGSVPVAGPVAFAVSFASSQRAPAIEELYAGGPHAATRTFETGDPGLGKERSNSIELALRQSTGPVRWKIGGFQQRFSNYIAGFSNDANGDGIADRVDGSGTIANSPGDPGAGEFSSLLYRQAPARFTGLEAELAWRPTATPWTFKAFTDRVRGSVEGLGAPPRMPPVRVGVSADYAAGPWAGFLSVLHAARQDRTALFETATAGYTRVDAEISRSWSIGARRTATLFLQGRNLLNDEIRLATSFVKDDVPMPARSAYLGLRLKL